MSELPMRGHFRYLRFKTFPMTSRTPQCEVFCPFLSRSEHSGVSEDSQPPTFPSVGLHPHTWPKWGCDKNPHTTLSTWFAFNKTAREHLNPSAPLRLALNTLYHDFSMHCHMEKEGKAMGTLHMDVRSAACWPHVLCATLRGGEVLLASFVTSRAWGYVF
jgi:hypothetical protein